MGNKSKIHYVEPKELPSCTISLLPNYIYPTTWNFSNSPTCTCILMRRFIKKSSFISYTVLSFPKMFVLYTCVFNCHWGWGGGVIWTQGSLHKWVKCDCRGECCPEYNDCCWLQQRWSLEYFRINLQNESSKKSKEKSSNLSLKTLPGTVQVLQSYISVLSSQCERLNSELL